MYKRQLALGFFLFFVCLKVYSQITFEIIDHKVNEKDGYLELYVNGLDNGNPFLPNDASKFKVTEIKSDDPTNEGEMEILVGSFNNIGGEAFQLLFLMDKSGTMRDEKFTKAKQAILSALTNNKFPANSVSVAFYHETVTESRPLSLGNFQATVGTEYIKRPGKDTHLYYSLNKKIEEWKNKSGRKVIILLTDGKDDIYGDDKKLNELFTTGGEKKVTHYNMIETLKKLDTDFQLHCIAFGADADSTALKEMVDATPNPDDKYLFSKTPNDLAKKLGQAAQNSNYNLQLAVRPKDFCKYENKERTLKLAVDYNANTYVAERDYLVGQTGVGAFETFCNTEPYLSLPNLLTRLGIIIFGLLILFVVLVPIFVGIIFRRKYVKKYRRIKKVDIVAIDPITTLEIEDQDLVVHGVCPHINLYNSWKENNKCGEKKCGRRYALHSSTGNILKQSTELDKRLSWVWYGALGGGIAWLLNYGLSEIDEKYFTDIFSWLTKENFINSYQDALNIGMALGFGVLLTFGIAEEYGQTRERNFGRVVLRSLIGAVVGGILYVLLNFINQNLTNSLGFVSHLFTWVVFGLVLSMLISLWSSIETINAFKAGVAASVAAFLVYYLLTRNSYIEFNDQFGKMLGLVIYGAILGLVLNTVVSRLEDFYLDFISPDHARGKRPISKWLKSNSIPEVIIGSDASAYVNVKWDPKVLPHHASMTYEGGKVFIHPKGSVIINGREINDKTALKNNDIIKLGMESSTSMRFVSKAIEQNQASRPQSMQTSTKQGRTPPAIEFYDDF